MGIGAIRDAYQHKAQQRYRTAYLTMMAHSTKRNITSVDPVGVGNIRNIECTSKFKKNALSRHILLCMKRNTFAWRGSVTPVHVPHRSETALYSYKVLTN